MSSAQCGSPHSQFPVAAMETDLPAYSSMSFFIPAPLYSEQPRIDERVLHSGQHSGQHPTEFAAVSQVAKHLYKSNILDVRLHPPHWGLVHPAYGQGGTVDGLLTFRRKCTHILEVSISLLGVINTSANQHPTVAVPGGCRTVILRKKKVLFSSWRSINHRVKSKGATVSAGEEYPFAIQFPSNSDGQHDALPPSYTVYQPGITTQVLYCFRVDVVRKGWRRHKKLCVPVLYLPKSRPTLPPVDVPWGRTETSTQSPDLSTDEVLPLWPRCSNVQQQPDDLPRIWITMPTTKCFASGEMIAVTVKIECPRSPALVKLLSNNVRLEFVKRHTWTSGALVSVREQFISRADLYLADVSREGMAHLRLEVQAGEVGRECSWRVKDSVAVEHVMRLVIFPPEHLKDLPKYKYEVLLTITTDQYGTEQSEMLAMGGIPFPALGLKDVQRFLSSYPRYRT